MELDFKYWNLFEIFIPIGICNFLNRYLLQWIKKNKYSAAVMLSNTCT